MEDLIRAIALVLIIEGILPFLSPDGWRQAMLQAGRLPDRILRYLGLGSMLVGVIILYMTR
jgi:uncharacterized protein YjeT (DUF2065 family)